MSLGGINLGSIGGQIGSWFSPGHADATIDAPQNLHDANSQSAYAQSVGQQNQGQQQYAQALQQWQQSRQLYYQQMQQGMQQAGQGQLQDQFNDAQRQQSYAAARSGNMGGAADLQTQGRNQQSFATGLGSLENQAYGTAQAQQMTDAQNAQQWYTAFQNNPAMQAQYQQEMLASQARQGVIPGMGQAAQQVYGNNSIAGGQASAGFGQALSGMGNAFSTASQLGYFNQPQQNVFTGYLPQGSQMTDYGGGGYGIGPKQ